MTCERHGGNAGSIMCRECDLETIERHSMTAPTPDEPLELGEPDSLAGTFIDQINTLKRELDAARYLKERFQRYLADAYTREFDESLEMATQRVEKMEAAFLRAYKERTP